MSTSATATAREPDDQRRTNRWLKYVEEDETSPLETSRVEPPTAEPSVSFNLARVEKLVGQLEARSMALVKYGYAERPQPSRPASNNIAIASALVALWFSLLALALAFVFLNDHVQQKVGDQSSLPGKRIISPLRPEQKLNTPVDQLAKSLTSSSRRRKRLEAAGERSKADPQKTRGAAVPHWAADGTVDYWMLPPGPYDNSPTKAFFVGKAANGVVVRNLEDSHYYIVTPSGSWHRISVPLSAN